MCSRARNIYVHLYTLSSDDIRNNLLLAPPPPNDPTKTILTSAVPINVFPRLIILHDRRRRRRADSPRTRGVISVYLSDRFPPLERENS